MNYVNYVRAIKKKHHVQLIGWPPSIKFQYPSKISSIETITHLRDSLVVSSCKWQLMSKKEQKELDLMLAEAEENGVMIGKKRKTRSDKRGTASNSDEEEAGNDESSDESQSSSKGNETSAAKSKSRKKKGDAKLLRQDKSVVKKGKGARKAKQHTDMSRLLPPKSKVYIEESDESNEEI